MQRIDLGSARNQQVLDTGLQVAAVVVLEDPMPGSAYCYGLQCPCGNDDGLAGCTNSVGEGAWLRGTGSASASADELVLFTSNVPAQRFGVLFMTNTPQAGVPFGDGLLCGTGAGGGFRRFAPKNSGQLGFFSHRNLVQASAASFGPGGTILNGSTWSFQQWFRDDAGPCGSGFNTTNSFAVTFTP